MKMNEMMSNVSRFAAKAKFKVGKHSPKILMVCGAVGAVTSAVMACKATLKVNDILAAHQSSVATVNMIFHGDDRPRSNYSNYAQPSRVSYSRYSDNRNSNQNRPVVEQINYQDIIFSSRGDAEEVLSQMIDALATYNCVFVADLYDLVGMTFNYTENKYGWYDLRTAYIQGVSGGYVIRLPKPVVLNN